MTPEEKMIWAAKFCAETGSIRLKILAAWDTVLEFREYKNTASYIDTSDGPATQMYLEMQGETE